MSSQTTEHVREAVGEAAGEAVGEAEGEAVSSYAEDPGMTPLPVTRPSRQNVSGSSADARSLQQPTRCGPSQPASLRLVQLQAPLAMAPLSVARPVQVLASPGMLPTLGRLLEGTLVQTWALPPAHLAAPQARNWTPLAVLVPLLEAAAAPLSPETALQVKGMARPRAPH